MFSTFKQRLLLGIFVFILISIPIGAYLVSQSQTTQSSAKEQKSKAKTEVTPKPKPTATPVSAARQLLDSAALSMSADPTPSPSPSESEPTTSYGPTLSIKVVLEGRSAGNQTARLFIGIIEGNLTTNPRFLLSFTVDLPATGNYSNLSLAGLDSGSRYTALLKGSAQIATSSAFTMSPSVTNLNSGQPLTLLSGDLNDDNVINSADYSIAKKGMGASANSSNWNANSDLNKDGIINAFDLGIIAKNIGKTGASGAWTSPLPQTATPSSSLTGPPVGGPNSSGGYWIWVPEL